MSQRVLSGKRMHKPFVSKPSTRLNPRVPLQHILKDEVESLKIINLKIGGKLQKEKSQTKQQKSKSGSKPR